MSTLEGLHLRLDEFEGPLSLLLHLIERNELEVTRVSVAAVADQFLALVATIGQTDLVTTGEFLAAAARLLLIKSRALLRAPLTGVNGEEEPDDAEALARQIAEYRRYQHTARALGALLESDALTMTRPASTAEAPPPARPPAIVPAILGRAAIRILRTPIPIALPAADWPEVRFATVRADLLRTLRRLHRISFSVVSADTGHPLVLITQFLALLELVRGGTLRLAQDQPYGAIHVTLRPTKAADA